MPQPFCGLEGIWSFVGLDSARLVSRRPAVSQRTHFPLLGNRSNLSGHGVPDHQKRAKDTANTLKPMHR